MTVNAVPFNLCPKDVKKYIFSFIETSKGVSTCCLVSKEWNQLARDDAFWNKFVCEKAIGKAFWEEYWGTVDEEPDLPMNIVQILRKQVSACPEDLIPIVSQIDVMKKVTNFLDRVQLFLPDEKRCMGQSYVLVFIPATVNGQPLDPDELERVAQFPKMGNRKGNYKEKLCYGDGVTATKKSHWVLMSKKVVVVPEDIAAFRAQLETTQWRLPTSLEASVAIFAKYVRDNVLLPEGCEGVKLFTLCEERVIYEKTEEKEILENIKVGRGVEEKRRHANFPFGIYKCLWRDHKHKSQSGFAPVLRFENQSPIAENKPIIPSKRKDLA